MRLIDADGLKPTKGMFIYQTEDADVIATEAYRWELIEREAPTVEAIPIEWLHSIMEKQLSVSGALACQVLANVIELWEKENEGNRR